MIRLQSQLVPEIDYRVSFAWKTSGPWKKSSKVYINNYIKSQIFNACIGLVIIYGIQTWTLTKRGKKICVLKNNIERSVLNLGKRDKMKIKTIKYAKNNVSLLAEIYEKMGLGGAYFKTKW